MSTLQDLVVKLGLDSASFNKGLNDASSKASSFGSTMTKVIGGLAIGAAVVTGVRALTGAIEDCVTAAIPLEGIQQSFDGLTASFEGGSKAMLKSLQESSYGMIKQSDLMKSFNTAASLVSTDFAKQLPDAMKYLSKVSAATGQDMNFMMDSLVKGVGRMSPMILDNLGIQVDLASATKRAAEMYGVEESALSKTQQQAGMMAIVLEKLETNTAAMPEVAGTAAQSFAALKANISNLKEEIGMKLLPVFTAVTKGLNDWISSPEGQASIDKFVGWIGKVIGTASPPTGLAGIVTYLMSGEIKSAVDLAFGPGSYDSIISFTEKIKGAIEDIVKAFTDMINAINAANTAYGNFLDFIGANKPQNQSLFSRLGIPDIPLPGSSSTVADRGWGRAGGGSVLAGNSYMVGERGIEMFTPGVSGTITPNNKLNNGVDMEALLRAVGIDYDRLALIVRDAVMQVAR